MQRFSSLLGWITLICVGGLPPAAILGAAEPPAGAAAPAPNEAADCVRKLGDEAYDQRRLAEKRLTELGLAARDTLLAGLQHADPEIRRGCRRALAEVLELDYQRRLQAFLQDKEGQREPDLPGWKWYRAAVGDGREARELFAVMQQEEAALLESLEVGSQDAVRIRLAEIWQAVHGQNVKQRQPPTLATLATMLLANISMRMEGPEADQFWANFTNLLSQESFTKPLKEGPHKAPLQILAGQWVRAPSPGQSQLQTQKLRLVLQHGLHEAGLDVAVRLLGEAPPRAPQETAMAVEVVARLGGKTHAARLLPLLTDERQVTQRVVNNNRQDVQVRDVTLAWLLQVTGQKPADYDLKQAAAWFDMIKQQPQHAFNYGNFFFEKDEQRGGALQKWAEWVKKNPLPAAPTLERKTLPDGPTLTLGGPGGATTKAGAEAAKPTAPVGLRLAEREQVQRLTQARRLVAEQEYAEAAVLLGEIVAADEDFYYQPSRDVPLYSQLKAQAEQLLGQLPPRGRAAYELHFGPLARRQLDQALARDDLKALAAVERKYFFTASGAEAAYLVGVSHRLAGRDVQAAMCLEPLLSRGEATERFEPGLSLQVAIAWQRAGFRDKARRALQTLVTRRPGATVEIGGRSQPLFTAPEDPLAWLERLVGPQRPRLDQWPVFRGELSGAAQPPPGGPYLQAVWRTAVVEEGPLTAIVRELQQDFVKQRRTVLPTLSPLIVEGAAVVRCPAGLRAVDVLTGQLRWESPALNGLWYLLRFGDDKQREAQRDSVADGLRQRLWEDPAFGSLSSDGRRVFAVEDLNFRLGPGRRRAAVRADGRREIDTAGLTSFNQLAAYDLRTGKVVWEVGCPPGTPGQTLAGGRFQGPPLPLGDQLYAVVEFPEQALLVVLDAATGALVQQWVLDSPLEEDEAEVPRRSIFNLDTIEPTRGISPVYADGLVVCRTSQNRYLAVDLATRSVRWVFAPPLPAPPTNMIGMAIRQQRKTVRQAGADRADQWSDGGAVIADGRVLLTPWESDNLYCLQLADGQLAWTAPRLDGLYLAGVQDGQVVVVGRGGVHTRRLQDGQAVDAGRAAWPPGAVPSGRGYLSQGRLYVPLASAEVAVYNVADGRLLARSLSSGNVVPENLVRVADYVVSCGPSGLSRFETLDATAARLAAADRAPGEDLPAFLKLTEVLLYQGQIERALDRLQQAQRVQATPEVFRLLAEALLQLTGSAWESRRELAAQIEAAIQDPPLRERFLQRLAAAYRDAGQWDAALETYLKLADLPADPASLLHVTAALTARRDRFVQGSLVALLERAPPDVRAKYEQRLAERLRGEPSAAALQTLGFHPAADETRLKLAAQFFPQPDRRLAAELLLRRVLRRGSAPHQAAAIAQLAELLRAAGKTIEAARFYGQLDGPLADTPCRDGKTGRELVAAIPADDPVRAWLKGAEPWPRAEPQKQVDKIAPDKATQNWNQAPVWITGDGTPWSPHITADVDMQTRKLIGCDGQGARQWELPPTSPENAGVFWFHNGAFHDAQLAGHLMVAWLGARLVAIDQLGSGGKPLWTVETVRVDANRWWMVPQFQLRMQLQAQIQQGQVARPRLPQNFVATTDYVAYQEGRMLKAVDPLTAQTLWLRDDLPGGCELFGDDEVLLVLPPSAEELLVLSAVDGHELGRRPAPEREKRYLTRGRYLLNLDTGPEHAELKLLDPWGQRTVWSRKFSAKARLWPLENLELAALEPDGSFVLLGLADGQPTLQAKVDACSDLDSILVLRNERRCTLVVNRPEPKQAGPMFSQGVPGHVRVEGKVYGLDGRTGERQWVADVTQQWLRVNYPTWSPVLTFCRRHQKHVQVNPNSWRSEPPYVLLRCLDSRTGKLLHDSKIDNVHEQSYGLDVDPRAGTVKVQTRLEQVTFRYPRP